MNVYPSSLLQRRLRCILLICSVFTLSLSAKTPLKISASTQLIDEFNLWTATTPWEQITDFKNPHAIRPVVELILQLQALKASGLDFDFTLIPCPNYERAKITIVQGTADLGAETIWDDELAENETTLISSDPIIRLGEFTKGIYVLPTNTALLKATTLEDIQAFTGAVIPTWRLDAKTVAAIKPKSVESPNSFEAIFLMIQKKRADFTLQEFNSTLDMSLEVAGVKLIPIPNCTVALMGNRSWAIAKASPHAAIISEALKKGILSLRNAGTIEKAFTECGFFNPRVKNWKRIL